MDDIGRRDLIVLLGSAVAVPLAAYAQQPLPVIGFLHQGLSEPPSLMNAFRKGLSEVGFVDGKNVMIEDRAADGHYDRLPALAAELVERRVAVIAANFLPAALAAKAATQTIPIVFLSGSDPIAAGLVSSINRPTGNVTGIAPMFTLLGTKNLELLHELVPQGRLVGVLANLVNPNADHQVKDLRAAAHVLGAELVVVDASNDREIDNGFATLARRKIEALIVAADGFLISRQDQIVRLAAQYAVPTMYPLGQYAFAGGLTSYGANLRDSFLQTGNYVGRVLKGTKPDELPVLQPTKVEFVINLKTAKALGLMVPDKLLALADEVIE
jgi:putative tryptophan/tyrosine transport system substrate-binding protein